MIDGYLPGQDGFALTPENRPAVQAWLKAEGIAPARVDGMRDDTLFKAYRWPAYLKQMKTRADYYPSCAKPKDDSHAHDNGSVHRQAVPVELDSVRERRGWEVVEGASTPHEHDSGAPAPGQGTDQIVNGTQSLTDPATILASLFVTEARVVELIREHAPLIIAELLKR